MVYTPQTWVDGSGGGTPIDADRLNYMEAGIAAASVASGVVTFNTRSGAVTLEKADVTGTGLGPADVEALAIANNLSDLNNVGDAVDNLGLANVATSGAMSDVGGELDTGQALPSTSVRVVWNGSAYVPVGGGSAVTTRAEIVGSRDDLAVDFIGGTSAPSGGLAPAAGDTWWNG